MLCLCLLWLLSSHPKKGRPIENSVRNGDILLAESILQVVIKYSGILKGRGEGARVQGRRSSVQGRNCGNRSKGS